MTTLDSKGLWDFFINRGIISESPSRFCSAFDILHHANGLLYYRLKKPGAIPEEEIRIPKEPTSDFFKGIQFQDPCCIFVPRYLSEHVFILNTHDQKNNPLYLLETLGGIPVEEYLVRIK